ncbi:pyridoxamine 5'-phosphate oxidase family protein [Nocardia jinanensis]|uniref:Pyridoxamine 5'-phosphate oxidase N-terminal domain-containing protein n=1 Tax=Nocardia jinanensis TaxID=382504 RepID=A0A917VQ22_9NOCA|nr:pyridoxamine 5'-phosphate oxidase family protein [Nocardia jinanensis]GGL02992.1 hypothetical protein GCM10011588_17120 [Nocardia jinanensis]
MRTSRVPRWLGHYDLMVRSLRDTEIAELLDSAVIARLATIDADGYPHITPIWFLWTGGAFHLTSYSGRPHLARIRAEPRVGLVVDVEHELRADGERPNRQVRVIGDAGLSVDADRAWTERIRDKYIDRTVAPRATERHPVRERILITVTPRALTAVASI